MATSTVAALVARSFTGVSIAPPTITPVHISIDVPSITPFTYTPEHRTDCATATPDPDGFVPAGSCNALWQYFPSIAAAVVFSIVFGGLLIAHTTQAIVFRKRFCWVIITATAWELGSFATRALAVHQQQNTTLATVSQLLVLLAPLWINAFVYMVFARLIYFLMPTHRVYGLHASRIAFIFVWLDVLSFFIQLIGGFIAAPGAEPSQITDGLHVYVAGIGIQEFWIVLVLGLAARLWVEVRRLEASGGLRDPVQQRHWRRNLIVLYVTLGLITVRVIFRLIEFSGGVGTNNSIPFHEWYFYVFDAVPMAIATLLLSALHPGVFLKGPFSDFPSLRRVEKKEVKRLRKEAQATAKANGEGFWGRWRLGRDLKRRETERIAIEKWDAAASMLQTDQKVEHLTFESA